MNTHCHRRAPRPARAVFAALAAAFAAGLMTITPAPAIAAPGAHGPNGEHLDSPATKRAASALPRIEAKSEAFELVAELRATELVVVVDRFESNEPVLGAKLEVESGALKAAAAFRAEHGDYAVTDAAMLAALAAPGEHGLVFTLVTGKDSDLLDGTLVGPASRAAAAKDDHGHVHGGHVHGHSHALKRAAWTGAGVAVLGLIGGIAWWRQRRREAGNLQGGM